ncbi:hypothetical protein CMI38_06255 [Candidatus Pacearchaeota archaeon]|jgi:hypothetical protein|nr:hypothetical protein [Candidatus Pacearchaeota archaeon]|tara:strand:+ start:73 stop:360 length:288 start_codon:yes stop_codon:yes gene_type:complete
MYNYEEIKQSLEESKAEIERWLEELENNQKDLLKFYKKGNKRAGIRLRRWLKRTRDEIHALRQDIYRLYKEREIFKGTEFDKDYKRTKYNKFTSE